MRKNITKLTAISMAFVLMLTGCSLGAKEKDEFGSEATEQANVEESLEETSVTSTENSSAAPNEVPSDRIIVVEDLAEPEIDESASSSTEASVYTDQEEKTYEIDKELEMVFFGDSQFANGRNDGTDIASYVQKRVPNGKAYNLGIGGTTAALEYTTVNYQDYENWTSTCFVGMAYALEGRVNRNQVLASYPEVLEQMNQVDPATVDYYFIEYGANDFFNKIQLDKWSSGYADINPLHTYYGALKAGIDVLRNISPNATIILITPFYGLYFAPDGTYLGDTYITSNGVGTLQDYAKKMNNVAEEYGLYCLDTMTRTKCDLYMDTANQYLMDNIHLTVTGRQIFGRIIAHIPNSMEGYEPTAYRQTEYIKIAEFNPDEYYKYPDEYFASDFPEEYEKYMNGEYLLAKPEE